MSSPTRAAVISPPGTAAVATIALVGPAAWAIARSGFRGALPEEPNLSGHWFGNFGAGPGDQVVLTVQPSASSTWVAIHCHGGPQVVRWLLADLQTRGAAVVSWRELATQMETSPLRAAALVAMTQCVTTRTAGIALDQYHGACETEIRSIADDLARGQSESATDRLQGLLQFANVGRHLTSPWRIAIVGAPNVGKSSLVNRLVGYPRCVVTPIAGTTRDAVATTIAIDGWPVELIDTAGQHETNDALEQAGIAAAAEAMRSADLVLWLFDATSNDLPPPGFAGLQVQNKLDLLPSPPSGDVLAISALTGDVIDDLLAELSRRLVPLVPPPGAAAPFSTSIVDRLETAANLLAQSNLSAAGEEVAALLSHAGSTCPP